MQIKREAHLLNLLWHATCIYVGSRCCVYLGCSACTHQTAIAATLRAVATVCHGVALVRITKLDQITPFVRLRLSRQKFIESVLLPFPRAKKDLCPGKLLVTEPPIVKTTRMLSRSSSAAALVAKQRVDASFLAADVFSCRQRSTTTTNALRLVSANCNDLVSMEGTDGLEAKSTRVASSGANSTGNRWPLVSRRGRDRVA